MKEKKEKKKSEEEEGEKKEERKRGQEKKTIGRARSLPHLPPLSLFLLSQPFRLSPSLSPAALYPCPGNRRRAQAAPRRAHGRPRRHAAPHLPRAGARAGRLGDARVPRRRRRAYAAPGHALAGDGRRRRRRRRPPRRSLLPPARVLRARGLRGRRCCSRRRRRIRRSFCRAPTAGQRRDAGRGL